MISNDKSPTRKQKTKTANKNHVGELHDRHWHDGLGRGMNRRRTTCRRVTVLMIILIVRRRFLLDKLDTIRDGFAVVRVIWVITTRLYDVGGSAGVVVRGGFGQRGQHDQAEYSLPETLQQRHWRQAFVLITDVARVASEPGHA